METKSNIQDNNKNDNINIYIFTCLNIYNNFFKKIKYSRIILIHLLKCLR